MNFVDFDTKVKPKSPTITSTEEVVQEQESIRTFTVTNVVVQEVEVKPAETTTDVVDTSEAGAGTVAGADKTDKEVDVDLNELD